MVRGAVSAVQSIVMGVCIDAVVRTDVVAHTDIVVRGGSGLVGVRRAPLLRRFGGITGGSCSSSKPPMAARASSPDARRNDVEAEAARCAGRSRPAPDNASRTRKPAAALIPAQSSEPPHPLAIEAKQKCPHPYAGHSHVAPAHHMLQLDKSKKNII